MNVILNKPFPQQPGAVLFGHNGFEFPINGEVYDPVFRWIEGIS